VAIVRAETPSANLQRRHGLVGAAVLRVATVRAGTP
jgi:hypothetical protein